MAKLKELFLGANTIKSIETEAFVDLKSREALYLNNLGLHTISQGAFHNLPSLKEINLQDNYLDTIQGSIFYNTPALVALDLTLNYYLQDIGTVLENISQDALVNLTITGIETIPERSFRGFLENVIKNKRKGKIDLKPTTGYYKPMLKCLCDIKWLVNSKMDVSNILLNATCQDGKSFDQVKNKIDKRMIP